MTDGDDFIARGPCCSFPDVSCHTKQTNITAEDQTDTNDKFHRWFCHHQFRVSDNKFHDVLPSIKAFICNPYDGAMFLPWFNIAIQATATNQHWYCDHHALAKSLVDGSPSIPHCVFDKECAAIAFDVMLAKNLSPKRIEGEREKVVLLVPSPEIPTTLIKTTVLVINAVQAASVTSEATIGGNKFGAKTILGVNLFGNEDIPSDVDATIILGHFLLNEGKMAPKLLLLRFTGMLSNAIFTLEEKNQMSNNILQALLVKAGKFGYEIRRTCGSSGLVNPQSDMDLAALIHSHIGLLPRPLKECVVFRHPLKYYIVYRSRLTGTLKHTYYSPPRVGGQLRMPPNLVAQHPVLAEFTYLKMFAVLIVESLNKHRVTNGLLPTATGAVACEVKKLEKSRKILSDRYYEESAFFDFLVHFNKQHSFSLVAHAVGLHHDHFKDDDESIENKLLLTTTCNGLGADRGGSVQCDHFVFALLDW